ncbi:MAG: hypothetical protein EPO22_03930 [Dehalococcoidia bacterium]|nr:MAG: hypothetical protein EPO22_03930 [Dehalococcoidia bacterium]
MPQSVPQVAAHEDSTPAPDGRSPWPSSESWTLTHSWADNGHCDYLQLPSLACQSSGTHVNAYYAQDFANGCDKSIYPIWDSMTVMNDHTQSGQADRLVMETTVGGTQYQTEYLHMNSVTVGLGATVNSDTVVGTSGNVGISSGCHLHVVVRRYHSSDARFYSVPATLCGRTYPPSSVGTGFGGCTLTPTPTPTPGPNPAIGGDYNGDGITDIAVWRPSTGQWFINWGQPAQLGQAGDVPVPADYNGDGITDIAVWRPSTGQWFSTIWSQPIQLGQLGDVPVPGYWNDDAVIDIGVWRPSTGQWFTAVWSQPVQYGQLGDIPVPGDYDGDRITEVAVWRPSTAQWFVNWAQPVQFGQAGDIPVPADYNGDESTDIAVWRPDTGQWFSTVWSQPIAYGVAGDMPVPGYRSTPAQSDVAVWRPSTGEWFINRASQSIQYGAQGDVALSGQLDWIAACRHRTLPSCTAAGTATPTATPTATATASPRPVSVGGIAEQPDLTVPPTETSTEPANHHTAYVLGGALLGALAIIASAAWAAKRRQR